MLGIFITHRDILNTNTIPVIERVDAILKLWSKRDLTLIGKIKINTLVASLFVHKMQVLPLMSEKNGYEIEIYVCAIYLEWKKTKSPLQTLYQLPQHGGLKLVNLRLRDIVLKIKWVQIIQSEPKCKELAMSLLHPSIGDEIFKCNLREEHVRISSKDRLIVLDRRYGVYGVNSTLKLKNMSSSSPYGTTLKYALPINLIFIKQLIREAYSGFVSCTQTHL